MKSHLRFWAPVALLTIQSGIWALVWIVFYSGNVPRQIYWKGHLLVAAVYFVILFAISGFYGALRIGYQRYLDVALSGWISLFLADAVTWAQVCLIGSKVMPPLPVLAMAAVQAAVMWLWAYITEKLYIHAVPPRRMLLLYCWRDQAKSLILKLVARSEKYQIQECMDVSGLGSEEVFRHVLQYEAIIICGLPPGFQRELQEFCFKNSVRMYTAPGIGEILTRGAAEINLFDTPLLLNRNHGLSEEQKLVKRIFDVVVSVLMLLIFFPLILLTALAVKMCDAGPVIYAQERLTLDGRRFMLYKFRSMKVKAEENGARLSTVNDDRVTTVGKVIRAIRFDEFPQLFNILRGDMSLVGPRPERPEIAEEYLKDMPEFDYRLKVKAGLTGYAQVYGGYNTGPRDKLLMDLIYISEYSLILDLKILFMTVKTVFQRERAKGIEK